MHNLIHLVVHLCLERPKIAGAIGFGLALVFGTLAFASWQDMRDLPESPEELPLFAIAARVESGSKVWAIVSEETIWDCDNLAYEKVGESENTEVVFTNLNRTVVVVATFTEKLQCDAIQKFSPSGVFYSISDQSRSALIENGIDLNQYKQAEEFISLCTVCGRTSSKGLFIISAIITILGLALYPLCLWQKRRQTS